MHQLNNFQDGGTIRIVKPSAFPIPTIAEVIAAYWTLLETAHRQSRRVTGHVRSEAYDIAALQPYVEGPVLQLSGPDEGVDSATYLLFMHPMDIPRPDGPFAHQVVDSGLHFHLGARNLTVYIDAGALIAIPCLTLPRFVNMEESADYILRPIRWPTDAGHERDGWEIVLLPGQVLEVEFGPRIAHSFNAMGKRCLIVSRHPDEALELAKARERSGFREMADGSIFLAEPKHLSDADLHFYRHFIR
jgi:hypothetical protein